MKAKTNVLIYIVLIAFAAIFLFIQRLTHIEFMLHVAAFPLEVLVAVFIDVLGQVDFLQGLYGVDAYSFIFEQQITNSNHHNPCWWLLFMTLLGEFLSQKILLLAYSW